ncbi:MAG: MFS transporter [Pirellulaceae bacterium]
MKSNTIDPIAARVPFFYGWVMLPIAVAGLIATSPGQTYSISVFSDAFRRDLGLSHTALTGAYMIGTLLAAIPVSWVGALMDRYGIRRVMAVVVVLFGAACLATSQVTGLLTLFSAFLMLRMLGQGALTLLSSNTVAMWFHSRLGTASGLMCLGTAFAMALVPRTNLYLIDRFGWRAAYALLGTAVWVVMLPLLAVFFRNRPEDIGQLPDGKQTSDGDEEGPPPADAEGSLTLPEAVRTRAYWILLSMNAAWAFVVTAIVFHIVSLFDTRGFSPGDVAVFFSYFAVSMAATQFLGGFLADRLRLNLLYFISMSGMTLSVAYLNWTGRSWSPLWFAVALGSSQGLFIVLGQTVWARYFGRVHLGKIRGTAWTASVAGSSAGPFVMGVTKDLCGVYTPAIWLCVGLYAALTIAALFATPPRRSLSRSKRLIRRG